MEFHSRENGLGDLTDDILAERGDFGAEELYRPTSPRYAPDVQTPPQMLSGQVVGQTQQNYPLHVASVFETLPFNARDFIISDLMADSPGFAPGTGVLILETTVPAGYIAVLKNVRFLPKTIGKQTFEVSVLIDGTPDPYFSNFKGDIFYGENIPCNIIANSGSKITLQITQSLDADYSEIDGAMSGFLLLSRGYPSNYEIGSAI